MIERNEKGENFANIFFFKTQTWAKNMKLNCRKEKAFPHSATPT